MTSPTWTPGSLSSGLTVPVSAQSYVYSSFHPVEAIQFATVQSLPVELIPNDQFQDSAHYSTYNWTNPTDWTQTGDATIAFDPSSRSAVVTRVPSPGVNPAHGLIRPPVAPVMAESSQAAVALTGGGLLSPQITPSAQGLCYAAARIVPIRPLSNPVWLQLIDASTHTVVHQWPLTGGVGQQIQGIYPFTIGQYAPAGTVLQLALVQEDNDANAWVVQGLSFFDEGIYWQFSVDGGTTWFAAMGIRNNYYGILSFPTPGNRLMWKVTFYQPQMVVSGIELRPHYQGDPFTARGYGYRGPTLEFTDTFASIYTDPLFNPNQAVLPRTSYNPVLNRDQVGLTLGPIPVIGGTTGGGGGIVTTTHAPGLPLPIPAEPGVS